MFTYLEIQTRLMQNKAYYKRFYTVWKEMSYKPLNAAAAKKYFSSESYTIDITQLQKKVFLKWVYHWYNLLRWMLIQLITWRHRFFIQIYRKPKLRSNHHVPAFFEIMFWKKPAFYIRYLYNNIKTLLIPNV